MLKKIVCVFKLSDGKQILLEKEQEFATGGEATIYKYREKGIDYLCKIYHNTTNWRSEKIHLMYLNPPTEIGKASKNNFEEIHHSSQTLAWPIDLLYLEGNPNLYIGFIMKFIPSCGLLFELYNIQSRRDKFPDITLLNLIRVGRNLSAVISVLHRSGYVVGDLHESNILITDSAQISIVDVDSFQTKAIIKNLAANTSSSSFLYYRCLVGKQEYTPAELIGLSFLEVNREPYHDLFGLAVLLFQLFFEGVHPFSGVYIGKGEPTSISERIKTGEFPLDPYKIKCIKPMPNAVPFDIIPAYVKDLFLQAFVEGHRFPDRRPTADKWKEALERAELDLKNCDKNYNHKYFKHNLKCPWCHRLNTIGVDSFHSPVNKNANTRTSYYNKIKTALSKKKFSTSHSRVNLSKNFIKNQTKHAFGKTHTQTKENTVFFYKATVLLSYIAIIISAFKFSLVYSFYDYKVIWFILTVFPTLKIIYTISENYTKPPKNISEINDIFNMSMLDAFIVLVSAILWNLILFIKFK